MKNMDEILDKQDCYKVLNDASPLAEVDIPVKADNRVKTDLWFLLVFAAFAVTVVPFLIYTLSYSNVGRLNRYDSCGNVCGQKNDKIEGLNCSGQDMTDKPFYAGSCYNNSVGSYFKPLGNSLHENIWKLLLLCPLPLGFSLILTKFLQYATAVAVWILLVVSWLSLIAITVLHWLAHAPTVFIALPGIATIIFMCVVIFNVKKMSLVILVLRESAKAVSKSGAMTCVSLAAFILEAIILPPCIIISCYLFSAGEVFVSEYGYVYYFMDNYMIGTIILFAILVSWVIHFVTGIHNMVLSGAIIRGYFTRKQIEVKEAVLTSFLVAIINHLGTAALQSLLFLIVAPPTLLLFPFKLLSITEGLADRILKYTDAFFSRNVCVVTAMHGTSFFQSGVKAVKLSEASIGNSIAIGRLVDFVITLTQIIVISITWIVTFFSIPEHYHSFLYCLIVFGFSYISAITILESFKTASATIHLCVAQDCLINKEEARPYNMSMEKFLDGSYELFATKVRNRPPPTTDDI